jgi:mRNA interferase MazF
VVARGEIWLASLDPTVGSEIRKSRPCVVISPPEMHDHLRTVIVAPMTTGALPAPYRIAVTFRGAVTASTLSATMKTLQTVFAA